MATREQLIEDFADHKYATGEKFARLINSMKVVQEPVETPAASGTSLSFIDSIEQDADGKITATKKTLDLSNVHELNPFKGWWKTGDTLPTSGFDGAYLYFKDTTQTPAVTTIYQWNGTAYADTGTEVDESNVQTFETGQAVNAVKIKDKNGTEVSRPAGVLSAEAGAELSQDVDFVRNVKNSFTDLCEGNITNTGMVEAGALYRHTPMLPVVNGRTYVSNVTTTAYCYYSEPYFDNAHFLAKTASLDANIPSGARYVSIVFYNQTYIDLKIVSRNELNVFLTDTCFDLEGGFQLSNETRASNVLNFAKYAVKGFYLHGTGVDVTKTYTVHFTKWDGTDVRVIIKDGSTNVLDATFAVTDGVVDVVLTSGNYNLRIILDTHNIATFSNTSGTCLLNTNQRAFSSIMGNPKTLEAEIKHIIDDVVPTINDADSIDVMSNEVTELDYLDYLTDTELGCEPGYVMGATGAAGNSTVMVRSAYIPLNYITAVKAKTPYGSGAGAAFYSNQSVAGFVSGFTFETGGDGESWVEVPSEAKYLRVTAKNEDITGGVAVFMVKKRSTESLQDFVDGVSVQDVHEPRNTHVLFGYESFVEGEEGSNGDWVPSNNPISESRNSFVVANQDDDVRQMISKYPIFFNKFRFEAAFEVNDAGSFFGIGTDTLTMSEVRVHNVTEGGDTHGVLEVYAGASGADTYEAGAPRVVLSQNLNFAIAVGNVYKLGIRRFENETYNGTDHMDGVEFYVTSHTDGVTTTIFVPRDSRSNGGLRNGITAASKGYLFVSVKVGNVTVDNVFVSSSYDTHAKVMMIGDSWTDGDTLIGTDSTTQCGQQNKLACLLQSAIGTDCFVIAGKGGDKAVDKWLDYKKFEMELFLPTYLIIQNGANHTSASEFEDGMTKLIEYAVGLGIIPVLMTVCPSGSRSSSIIAAMSAWVKNSGYRYVDIAKYVTVDGLGVTWITGMVNSDNVHPTQLGHQTMYEAFVKELPEIFDV